MRSLALAVVIFAGILAYSSAAPQITRGDLTWLENILRGLGSQNSTIRFGNNTLIVSGVSTASANVNPSPAEPHRPHHPNQSWGNWGPGYGGYWRMVPSENGEIVEELENNNSYDSNDFAFDLAEDESVEDIIEEDQSDEDQSISDASSEAEDELDEEADEDEDDLEEGSDQEDVNESQDEEVDLEEDAADKELDEIESELPAEKTN
ncbi:GL24714 [Drosophila persimilis]|uniref:GL24714 n=1 Tax=Drosophila persimilis TaxID=7234 RepID=B4GUF9_DROPE|nr:acidic leucine-rich nuclear phosphoprotein 32 family member B [Drosophila persimilis]EDW26242.1 GL24714 [Drosophila persimilis]